MGPPAGLKDAEEVLNQLDMRRNNDDENRFEFEQIKVARNSALSGKTLMELNFRQRYGVNLIGIRRGEEQITAISPAQTLLAGDELIVIGKSDIVNNLKEQEPL